MKRTKVFSFLVLLLSATTVSSFAADLRRRAATTNRISQFAQLSFSLEPTRMDPIERFSDTVPVSQREPVKEVPKSKKQVKPEPVTGKIKSTVKPVVPPVVKPVIVKPKQIIKPVIKIK